MKKLFIALPVHEMVDPQFFKCCMRSLMGLPIRAGMDIHAGDSLVTRARNACSAKFLKSDCSHILFIDSDIVFGQDHIMRLFGHDKDIVAGFYPKKVEGDVQWCCNSFIPPMPIGKDGLQRMRYMGTGFMQISRRVFEVMIERFGKDISFIPDGSESKDLEYDFWGVGCYNYGDGTRRYLSEDWWFCQKAMDCGFEVWGDTRAILRHSGNISFPTREQDIQLRMMHEVNTHQPLLKADTSSDTQTEPSPVMELNRVSEMAKL